MIDVNDKKEVLKKTFEERIPWDDVRKNKNSGMIMEVDIGNCSYITMGIRMCDMGKFKNVYLFNLFYKGEYIELRRAYQIKNGEMVGIDDLFENAVEDLAWLWFCLEAKKEKEEKDFYF